MSLRAGFDIGGTNARLALFDDDWNQVDATRERIRGRTQPQEVVETLAKMLDGRDVSSVGVGIAAQLGRSGEVVENSPNLGWRDVAFAKQLRKRLAGPEVRVVNDLSAIVWGEFTAGAITGVEDVLAVYVGTGVGGAIISGGELVEGTGGKAGEIGHVKVAVGGRRCGCGQRGCVEAYAGGVHLESQVREIAPQFASDIGIDLKAADEAAQAEGELAEMWERVTDYLAISIANAVTLTNPRVLLLGGGILTNLEHFWNLTHRKLTPLVLEVSRDELEIRFGTLGEHAGVLGAAALATDVQ